MTACGSLVLKTFGLTVPSGRANAFKLVGNSCEIGRVSPFYGFLEENFPPTGKDNLGYVLVGCSGNCE